MTIEDICEKVLFWCYENIGMSKYQDYLPFIDIDDNNDWGMMGEYNSEDNTIIIYKNYIPNIDNLISTVIHEYTHSLQSPGWYTRYANNMTIDEITNNGHPYEIQAEKIADTNTPKCKEQLNLQDKHWYKLTDTNTI